MRRATEPRVAQSLPGFWRQRIENGGGVRGSERIRDPHPDRGGTENILLE